MKKFWAVAAKIIHKLGWVGESFLSLLESSRGEAKSTFHFSHHQEIPSREKQKKAQEKKKNFQGFFSLTLLGSNNHFLTQEKKVSSELHLERLHLVNIVRKPYFFWGVPFLKHRLGWYEMQFAFMGIALVGFDLLDDTQKYRAWRDVKSWGFASFIFQTAWRTAKIPNAAKIPSVGKANCVTRFPTPLTFCWGNSRHPPRPPFSREWSSSLKTKACNPMSSAPGSTKGKPTQTSYSIAGVQLTLKASVFVLN